MKPLFLAMSAAYFAAASASIAGVERIYRKERPNRGNENIAAVQEADKAAWVWYPGPAVWGEEASTFSPFGDRSGYRGRFFRFRNEFASSGADLEFDVSADERFVLFLDGEEVARGPHRGMPAHWFYESYRAKLSAGKHVLEAVVWQIGPHAPLAQLSYRGGFLFKACGAYDKALSTGSGKWKVAEVTSTVMTGMGTGRSWGTGSESASTGTSFYYEEPKAADWKDAAVVRAPVRDRRRVGLVTNGWLLFPSALPDQMHEERRPGKFRAARNGADEDAKVAFAAADGVSPQVAEMNKLLTGGRVVIPANTSLRILWDLENYYCAFPQMTLNGGKGASVRWNWFETLRNQSDNRKGNRAAFADKVAIEPFGDTFLADGRSGGKFTTPWWRCGRWCEFRIKTADEPLEIASLSIMETRYPTPPSAEFACDDESINDIQRICTRALQMCMHEMTFDCPYFEQQMYPGDSRVQYLVAGTVNADERLVRQAITLFDEARHPNGLVPMNFPSRMAQESVTYTLCWVDMFRDYLMWRSDGEWLKSRIPGMEAALAGIARYENAEGLLENLPGWSFTDYNHHPGWDSGISPAGAEGEGVCAINNLQYAYALGCAAETAKALGRDDLAAFWGAKAEKLGRAIVKAFWSEERGMLADTVKKDCFSEQSQCFGILSGALKGEKADAAFANMLKGGDDLAKCTVYFSYYLFDTYFKYNRTDLFLKRLDLWRGYVKDNMCTLLESPSIPGPKGREARSDCHAWGAHPLYHLHASVLGVKPASPFFRTVRIEPKPGALTWIRAKTPHPAGLVVSDLHFAGDKVSGTVTLPAGLAGIFVWRGVEHALQAGENRIDFDATAAFPNYGVTLRDCCWMWGHDIQQLDGPSNIWHMAEEGKCDMPEGCRYMGIENLNVIRWGRPSADYRVKFRPLKRLTWAICGNKVEKDATLEDMEEYDFALLEEFPQLMGFDMDDFFHAGGADVQVQTPSGMRACCPSSFSYEQLKALRARMKAYRRPLDLRLVVYDDLFGRKRGVDEAIVPCVDQVDSVTYWIWKSENIANLEGLFRRYRNLCPCKPTFLGIYMYDFGNKRPMPLDRLNAQLELGLKWWKDGVIEGMVFLATSICNKDFAAVEYCRDWLRAHGDDIRRPEAAAFVRGRVETVEPSLAGGNANMVKALEFLRRKDLAELAPGRYPIDGERVFANVQECELKPFEKCRIEAHRRYIDVQMPLTGEEEYGAGRLTDLEFRAEAFDSFRDCAFYANVKAEERFTLKPGEFAVFYPGRGAHRPGVSPDGSRRKIRKLVIKVLADQLTHGTR